MSGMPAATILATNSSASMVKELEFMVSTKEAAEYCNPQYVLRDKLQLFDRR